MRAASGHATAAPPRSVMKWRRLRSSMQPLRALPNPAKRSLPHAEAAAEAPAGPGVDLNICVSGHKSRILGMRANARLTAMALSLAGLSGRGPPPFNARAAPPRDVAMPSRRGRGSAGNATRSARRHEEPKNHFRPEKPRHRISAAAWRTWHAATASFADAKGPTCAV